MSECSTIETLEPRRLLSCAADLGLTDTPPGFAGESTPFISRPLYGPITRSATPTLPNLVRTYKGSFDESTSGLHADFTLRIRKEQVRDTYASLKGELDVVTNKFGTLHGDMTYGKVRENLRVNITCTGTAPPFTFTINAKASTSGSQIKGEFNTTGSFVVSGTFLVAKFVKA